MSDTIRYDLVGEYAPYLEQMHEGDYVLYADYEKLRGLMNELRDYASQHDSWRCAHYGDCRCGLDTLFDKCGWERIPCKAGNP